MVIEAIEKGQFVIYFSYVLIGLGTFLLVRMLMEEEESRAVQENLADLRNRKATNALVRITRPFFTQYFVPLVRGKPFWEDKRKIFKRKLISAALREELTPDEFIGFKLFLILFFPIVSGILRALDLIDIEWYYIVGSAILGWFYPNFWVYTRIKDRQKKILRSLPFIVDLLALSTEAGLDFIGAIGKVVEKATSSPLVEELGQILREIKVGASRAEALHEMAYRVDMMEINSFVAILVSADQMGASIGKILRQQSEQIRIERIIRAEKAGAAAAQKILFPLVFLILPAVMLMIFGPFILSFLYPNSTG